MTTSEVRVVLPEEQHTLIQYREDHLPAVAIVNSSLADFAHGEVFRWHLSIVLEFIDLIENGIPSEGERELVDPFGEELDQKLKAPPELPNALFLARITWNGSSELLYRVCDPEIANDYLQSVISSKNYPRKFDFRMDDDPEWQLAKWFLDTVRNSS